MDQSDPAGNPFPVPEGAPAHRVAPGQALTLWEMCPALEKLFPGTPRPMPDRVTYRFANGWVDTGDLPCRDALKAWLPGRKASRPTGHFGSVFFGADGADADFSVFRHRPTLIGRGFRCRIVPDRAGTLTLRATTCGGINLWLGDDHVAGFEPFERNRPNTATLSFDLPAGESVLTLLLEDLHERDTTCFFSLVHAGGPELGVTLSEGIDLAAIAAAAGLLAGIRTDAVYTETGPVRLAAARPPAAPVSIRAARPEPFPRGGITRDPDLPEASIAITLGPDTPAADLFQTASAPAGCLVLDLATEVGGTTLTRRLGVTNLPPATRLAGDLAARKAQAAAIIAGAASFEPSVAALLALRGEAPDRVASIVAATLSTIEERHDCSDFSILPLLRLWRDAGSILPPPLRARLEDAVLGYRYWYDAPGNDVMWFWSENHVLCFHAAQLIAGTLFPDAIFTAHGLTGREMQALAHTRLLRWFDAIDEDGLCEWNSAAYYPIDFLGLFSLHDMAPSLRPRAAAVLDRIFVMAALHTTGGVPAGSQGRAYEKELLAGPVTELGSAAAIAFGGAYWPGHDRAASLFCLSDYAPPTSAARFAAPGKGRTIAARYTQGFGHAGKLSLWKSSDVQLSTVTALRTGERGHQAHVIDVQFAAHPMARLWINHPGELKVWGERRPSLLAGNHVMPAVAQHGPTALMIYDLERDWTDLAMTQLFAPGSAFDGIADHAGWRVFRSGRGQAAVWCSAPLAPVEGLYMGALHRAHALRAGWVVMLSEPDETATAFRARLSAARPDFDPSSLSLSLVDAAAGLSLTFGDDLKIDGVRRPFAPLSVTPQIGSDPEHLSPWTDDNG